MTSHSEELKLKVTEFDGSRKNSNRWLRSITSYLDINDTKYNSDKKKVIFALSFMTQGAASTWSEDYLKHAQSIDPTMRVARAGGTPFGYGTWDEFVTAFKKAFASTDSQGEAMAALLNLSQGRKSLVEYTYR
jgi:hypothetical protein